MLVIFHLAHAVISGGATVVVTCSGLILLGRLLAYTATVKNVPTKRTIFSVVSA